MSLIRVLATLAGLAAPVALLSAAPASAPSITLQCGTYQADDNPTRIVIESPNQGYRQMPGSAREPYLLRRLGKQLKMADPDAGVVLEADITDGGRSLEAGYLTYRLSEPARCKPPVQFPENSCRASIGTCLDDIRMADRDVLRPWCAEGVPAACKALLSSYETEAREAVTREDIGEEDPDLQEPASCKPNSGQYDAEACKEAASMAMAKAFASILLSSQKPAPLPAAALDDVTALCRAYPAGTFCQDVAQALWTAGRWLPARDALQLACTKGGNPDSCTAAAPLQGLTAADMRPVAATSLPCGQYTAATGLMDSLAFGDGGLVQIPLSGQLRARLEDGQIRIRHDKGDDFVLQPLANGSLIGVDTWNRYAYYTREGAAGQCAASVVFVEVPLTQDCPTGGSERGAQACCDAGRLQGCNAMGHRLALGDRWAEAAPYYQKMCTAGVREGCENLVTVYEHTGDEAIPESMQALCARDGKGTHVACDVHATRNWAMLQLSGNLERMADRLSREEDEDTGSDDTAGPAADDAPASSNRNRKGGR